MAATVLDIAHPDVVPDCLRQLYGDDHVLVFDKPAGLLSVPGRGPDKQDSMATRARAQWPDARVVHRLDMATSGLMLLARGAEAQRVLGAAFEGRRVEKRYIAVVDGWPTEEAGEINLPLLVDWPERPRQKIDPVDGKPALTRWRVLRRETAADGAPVARLVLMPVTGRSHQLRVHLQAIGHPILGDPLYAPESAQRRAPRLLLHAESLELPHPATGAPLRLHCPTPF